MRDLQATAIQSLVEKNPRLGFALILQLTGVHGSQEFDKLTKTKTVETILKSMDANGISSYVDYLLSQVDSSAATDRYVYHCLHPDLIPPDCRSHCYQRRSQSHRITKIVGHRSACDPHQEWRYSKRRQLDSDNPWLASCQRIVHRQEKIRKELVQRSALRAGDFEILPTDSSCIAAFNPHTTIYRRPL